jgi:hypothetical protein
MILYKPNKRSSKMKNLILVVVLLLVVSSLSFGQTATVTATVNAVLSITTDNNLAIVNVVKGVPKTVLSTDAAAAAFTIAGEPSTATILTVAFPANLVDGSSNNLPFTGQTPVYNTVQSQVGTTAYGALTGGTASLNAGGNLYVYVGGGVSPAVAQPSGNYAGTINVSVVYP